MRSFGAEARLIARETRERNRGAYRDLDEDELERPARFRRGTPETPSRRERERDRPARQDRPVEVVERFEGILAVRIEG